jgi:hypothetical protein
MSEALMKTLWRESALPSVTFILVHSGFICLRRMPLTHVPTQFFLRVFYRFRFPAMGHPFEACFIMGRQESAAGTPSPGIAATDQKS